jgi:hypothetical protein
VKRPAFDHARMAAAYTQRRGFPARRPPCPSTPSASSTTAGPSRSGAGGLRDGLAVRSSDYVFRRSRPILRPSGPAGVRPTSTRPIQPGIFPFP